MSAGYVWGIWTASGFCLRDPACCQGVIVSKEIGQGQLMLHLLAAALSPSALQYCLSGPVSGEGGCLWCLTVSGCCLRDPVCCQGGDSIKTSRERSVSVMLLVPQKMPL